MLLLLAASASVAVHSQGLAAEIFPVEHKGHVAAALDSVGVRHLHQLAAVLRSRVAVDARPSSDHLAAAVAVAVAVAAAAAAKSSN